MITQIHLHLKNKSRVFWAQVKKALLIQLAYPLEFVSQILTAVMIGLWFIFFINAVTDDPSNEYATFGIWGMVTFMLFSMSLWSIGRFIRSEQLTGTLESIWVTRANKFWIVFANGIAGFIFMLLVNLFVLLGFSFIVPILINNLWLGLFILLLEIIQALGFGFLYGALVIKIKNASAINNLVQFGTMVLSAVFFPFSVFPDWMLWISRLIPFSWIVDAFRSTMVGTNPELISNPILGFSPIIVEIFVIIISNVVLIIIGFYLFKRAINKAMREGHLSQY